MVSGPRIESWQRYRNKNRVPISLGGPLDTDSERPKWLLMLLVYCRRTGLKKKKEECVLVSLSIDKAKKALESSLHLLGKELY